MICSAGDKVRCVTNAGEIASFMETYLTVGKIYTARKDVIKNTKAISVVADDGHPHPYFNHRFEPAKLTNEERMAKRMEELCLK